MNTSDLVFPGDIIGIVDNLKNGENTFLSEKHIHSGVVGFRKILPAENKKDKEIVTVETINVKPVIVPKVGSTVYNSKLNISTTNVLFHYAKVVAVNSRLCQCTILCVNSIPLDNDYNGIIRSRDVRATEVDKVDIYQCFKPGDIVRAEVISFGDSRSYYLSTAKNEYGVIFAKSPDGEVLIPISWCEMQCPTTKLREKRKTAKPLKIS